MREFISWAIIWLLVGTCLGIVAAVGATLVEIFGRQ
jgi:hypothetical protein